MLDFDFYEANLDIWSLGIILYKLVYFRSPFCKSGKNIFSKTILREYLEGEYKIEYSK
jgi:serine/threonine protein kinase